MATGPDDPTILPGPTGTVTPPPSGGGPFAPGQKLGTRYTIIRLLGRGGMGAVYQAWDEELNVAVAIKVVLPDASTDPVTQHELQERFKRELLLARQVTHKNVVRIHDLGEINGLKYITMPFVEGETLGQRLRRQGHLPVADAVSLAKQIVDGLQAAHEVGIVHRDLKPDNILITPDGHALITDFGIARSTGAVTHTAAGAVIGTVEYMSPEQASGMSVDHRSDIYSFGLMLYDMLLGRHRLHGRAHPMTELMSRLQKAPPPPHDIVADIPSDLSDIVLRCTQPATDARFATTAHLAAALHDLAPDGHRRVDKPPTHITDLFHPPPAPAPAPRPDRRLLYAAAAAALVAAGAAAWYWRPTPPIEPAGTVNPLTVLIADFENATSEDVFNGVVEQALGLGLESASFISNYSRREALRAAATITPGATTLNAEMAQLVAQREGIDLVLAGAVVRESGGYRITANGYNHPEQSAPIFTANASARDKAAVLEAVGRLAVDLRAILGDTAAATGKAGPNDTFTAASLEAARTYARAQEAQAAGKTEEQINLYQETLKLDPDMARAYTGLGAIAYNQGRREDAIGFYKEAMARLDRMTEREKFRTRGGYFLAMGDSSQAIQENEQLVKAFPSDGAGFANLAFAYLQRRDFTRAADYAAKALALNPRHAIRASNAALFAMYAGDFQATEQKARTVLEIAAGHPRGHVALGMSQLARGQMAEAESTYQALLKHATPDANAFATYALADLYLYRGRVADAAALLDGALARQASPSVTARLQLLAADVRLAQNREPDAIKLAESAARSSRDPQIQYGAARILIRSGRVPQALAIVKPLLDAVDPEARALGALARGETELAASRARDALASFQEAQKLADTWLGRFLLARAYLALQMYPEAGSELDRCWTRRGEATAVFFDDIPTWRLTAPVHYYQGLARAGFGNSGGAGEAFKEFLAIKAGGDEKTPELADAQKRAR